MLRYNRPALSDVTRRDALKGIAAGVAAAAGCSTRGPEKGQPSPTHDVVIGTAPLLGSPWPTRDPFLFCVHHDDQYPAGDERQAPAASLAGRRLGADFEGLDGWRMYHGLVVPGFPQHPHRGFETVTVVRTGLLDHSDSLGAAARYGQGDVQWLTAGRGILHAEMFPLVHPDRANPLELFQIWLNLPSVDKMADPHFSMMWRDSIPIEQTTDDRGAGATITVVAGRFGERRPSSPPPRSWAARPDADVAIWTLRLDPGARCTLPAAATGTHRSLYFFRGSGLRVGRQQVPPGHVADLRADVSAELENGPVEAEALLLQGRPIGEPVVKVGPFVMNTREEIRQAFDDYHGTQFGGWPWPSDAPVHPREQGRFARLIDGRSERPA
jgi:redox-sensitive bicupin YhaK (pirin superfamily)